MPATKTFVPPPLQVVPPPSREDYLRLSAKAFLEGQQSFQWITQILTRSGLHSDETGRVLFPLRNHGDFFRAEALFGWLEKVEW